MRSFFARNLLFVVAVNLLVKPAWVFLIDRTVQNKVGHQAYGTFQPLLNLAIIFQILLDFGLNNYNSRMLSRHPAKVKQLFPLLLSARLILSAAYMIIVIGIGLALGYKGSDIGLLSALLGVQVMGSVIQLFRSTAAGLHQFKWDGLLSVSDRLLMIVICGTLLLIPATSMHFRLEWYVGALLASYGLAMLGGLVIMRRITGHALSLSLHGPRIVSVVRQSLPYALLILLMSLYTRSDFIWIERLGGSQGRVQAGIYATAYRLLDVGNMVGLVFANMLLPLLGRMMQRKQSYVPVVRLGTALLLPISLLISAVGIFYARPVMDTLYTDTNSDSATLFTLLMLAFPAFSLSNIYSTVLTAAGALKALIIIAATGVLINSVMNAYLVPFTLAVGAGIATLVTQWVVAWLFILIGIWRGQLRFRLPWALSFAGYFGVMVAAGYGLKTTAMAWQGQIGLMVGFGLLLMVLFRYVDLSKIRLLKPDEGA